MSSWSTASAATVLQAPCLWWASLFAADVSSNALDGRMDGVPRSWCREPLSDCGGRRAHADMAAAAWQLRSLSLLEPTAATMRRCITWVKRQHRPAQMACSTVRRWRTVSKSINWPGGERDIRTEIIGRFVSQHTTILQNCRNHYITSLSHVIHFIQWDTMKNNSVLSSNTFETSLKLCISYERMRKTQRFIIKISLNQTL